MTMERRGLFITFEGPDGSGKSTQIRILKEWLEEQGCRCILSREPGGTVISEKIRDIILDKEHREMDPRTEALLYAAARAQHVAQVIRPALEGGTMVICDRFTDSSMAYQAYGRGLGEDVAVINRFATEELSPDVTFLLQLSPEEGHRRIEGREQDRMELEKMDFHQRVFEGYRRLEEKEPQRIIAIDASQTIEAISTVIRGRMEELLSCR